MSDSNKASSQEEAFSEIEGIIESSNNKTTQGTTAPSSNRVLAGKVVDIFAAVTGLITGVACGSIIFGATMGATGWSVMSTIMLFAGITLFLWLVANKLMTDQFLPQLQGAA